MENPSKEQLEKWQKDPNNWKFGIFYFNKEDNRLFLDKRNPNLGVTINFANPKSFFALLIMICFFGFIVFMISLNKN